MASETSCPRCGNGMPAGATAGTVCPRCALAFALEEETWSDGAPHPGGGERDPETVGPFKVLERLGAGGMGVVYRARQQEPIQRDVAVKVIRTGLDGRQVLARFEAERQALALMDHPNVAKVYEAGTAEDGRPWFAMEYVRGVPITEFCDEQRLDTAERLRLFIRVCDGIQHAHQKGIIHRDVKPSNVLVHVEDGRPVPKIIDFGVAKATARPLTEKTLFTRHGQLIGTPEYMSPEQAALRSEDIDTRTDVYSLGVLLYELLVGELPFGDRELRGAAFDEICRRIREDEPDKPSTRVSAHGSELEESARRRRTDPTSLSRRLRGDLDWIVLKALEKDRARRYASPASFAEDVARHLAHEPVIAGPPSAAYRLSKFVRRHRAGVAAASVAVLLTLAGLAGTTYGLVKSVRAEAVARQEAETAERVIEFLVGLFEVSDPSEARGSSITAREVLDAGVARIESELEGQPEVRARLEATMGRVYSNLGLYPEAEPLLESALESRRERLGPGVQPTLDSLHEKALLLLRQGRLEAAAELADETRARRAAALGPEHPDALSATLLAGVVAESRGRLEEAEPLYREALAGYRAALGDGHADTITARNNLGGLELTLGNVDAADEAYTAVLEGRRAILGDDHPQTLESINNLAYLRQVQGRLDESEALYRDALEETRRVFGDEHPTTFESLSNMGVIYQLQARLDEAEAMFREALDGRRRVLGDDHPDTLVSIGSLALFLHKARGDLDEAGPLYDEALERFRRVLGDDHPDTITTVANVGQYHRARGDLEAAEPFYREAQERRVRILGPENPETITTTSNLAVLLQSQGKNDEAEALHEAALAGARKVLGEDHFHTLIMTSALGDFYALQGRPEDAEPLLTTAAEGARRALEPGHPWLGTILAKRGRCLTLLGRYDDAEAALLESYEMLSAEPEANRRRMVSVARFLAEHYEARGLSQDAEEWRSTLTDLGG